MNKQKTIAKVTYLDKKLRVRVGQDADKKFGKENSYVKNLWILKEYKKRGGKVRQTGEKPSSKKIEKQVRSKATVEFVVNPSEYIDVFEDDFNFIDVPSEFVSDNLSEGETEELGDLLFELEYGDEGMNTLYSEAKEDDQKGKKLNKPFRLPSGSKKKFGVYVKSPKTGNTILVKFGDPNMEIKRDDPERRKAFRDRHNCDQKKDKTTPGYWSCKMWSDKPVSKIT